MSDEQAPPTGSEAGQGEAQEPTTLLTDPPKADDKTEGETPPEGDGKTEGEEKTEGAPESYELTFAEGVDVDETMLGEFTDAAKAAGLTNEQAQAFVDLSTKQAAAMVSQQEAQWQSTVDGWANDARADPEIGGADMQERLGVSKKALDQFGTPALIEALNTSGMGNHPELIRFMMRVGKSLSEDAFVGGDSAPQDKTTAQTLYPTMNK